MRRLLGALPAEGLRRLALAPLSEAAVAALGAHLEREVPADLHAHTGGNPFFVTEALTAPRRRNIPVTVADAVAQRVGALDAAAQAVVELAAVVPGEVEIWLLEDAAGATPEAMDACVDLGLLQVRGAALAFRHELARRAVEDAVSPIRRRALDRVVLQVLEARGGVDPARLVHHARRAELPDAVRRLAPAAARSAAAAGSHREALEHWEAALAAGAGDDDDDALPALEGVAVEAYLRGDVERALIVRRRLLAVHERRGDDLGAGDDLRWLSRILWWAGRGADAAEASDRAIAALERFPGSRELALALSGSAQLAMLDERDEQAIAVGGRAVELGRRLGDAEIVSHALTNVGSAMLTLGDGQGRALLDEAFTLARDAGLHDHAARALVNLASIGAMRRRDEPHAQADLERALAFAAERDLDGYAQYLLGMRSGLRLAHGDWAGAEDDARASLAFGDHRGVSVCPAQVTRARLAVRRAAPDADDMVEQAWRTAEATGELQRLAPAAAARAEHRWLQDDRAGVVAAVAPVHADAVRRGDRWTRGELAWWLWRAGAAPPGAAGDVAEPYARALAGDAAGAAAAWASLGFTYEAAEAQADARHDDAARLAALATFDALGATRTAAHLRRRLRARRHVAHPARATGGHPGRRGRPDPAPGRGPRPARRGRDQRRDRRPAGHLAAHGRPPRGRRAGQARRDLAPRGARGRRPAGRGRRAALGLAAPKIGGPADVPGAGRP